MMKLNFIISPAIEGKYEVVNTTDPIYHSKFGKFDFRTITEEQAKNLVDSGTIYLRVAKLKK